MAEFGHKYPTNVKIFDEYAMRLKFFGELRFGFFGIPIFFLIRKTIQFLVIVFNSIVFHFFP